MQEILKDLLGVEDLDINTLQNRLGELLDIKIEDILALIPDVVRILVLAAPLIILALGLYYFLFGPKEANYRAGYRFRWGMGSVQAWQFTQKLAGLVWSALGLGLTVFAALKLPAMQALELADMMWQAIGILLVQGAAVLLSCAAINLVVFIRYDLRGNRRLSWKELLQG